MSEPHQRVQSGKLRAVSNKSYDGSTERSVREQKIVYQGLENSGTLEIPNIDDSYDSFMQSPTALSNLQVEILSKIAIGYGIDPEVGIDRHWRRTWNIGVWHIGNDVSVSFNIIQPNIASIWISINTKDADLLLPIVEKYKNIHLSKSTCRAIKTRNGCQLQGRWAPVLADALISDGIISREDIKIDGLNITQSQLFCWMLVGTKSQYLCTLTKDSVDILMRYIPDWCSDISEATAAANTTLRIKNPTQENDSAQLSITTLGWLQYNGKLNNLTKLHESISIAFKGVMKSIYLKTFLQSMQYQSIPNDF